MGVWSPDWRVEQEWVMLGKVWWHTHVQFEWAVYILLPRSGHLRASGALKVPDSGICVSCNCKGFCSSGYVLCRVDFPELTPFLGYVVKEKCSLNQMGYSHRTILGCPMSLIGFTPKNTRVSRSFLFCSHMNYRNKTSHHNQRSTLGSSCLKKN